MNSTLVSSRSVYYDWTGFECVPQGIMYLKLDFLRGGTEVEKSLKGES